MILAAVGITHMWWVYVSVRISVVYITVYSILMICQQWMIFQVLYTWFWGSKRSFMLEIQVNHIAIYLLLFTWSSMSPEPSSFSLWRSERAWIHGSLHTVVRFFSNCAKVLYEFNANCKDDKLMKFLLYWRNSCITLTNKTRAISTHHSSILYFEFSETGNA